MTDHVTHSEDCYKWHPECAKKEVERLRAINYTYTVSNPDYTDPEVQRRIMLEYMQLMIARQDWHGVADAAMDLREMDAERKDGR